MSTEKGNVSEGNDVCEIDHSDMYTGNRHMGNSNTINEDDEV